MVDLTQLLVQKTWMELKVITNIIQLLDEGNTIPFIARYRKELTQGASDEQLREFHEIYVYTKNLAARKEDVIRLIDEKGLLTQDLRKAIMEAETLARVEDLYRPFKEKKNTRATIAKAKGLQPLADLLKKAQLTKEAFEAEALQYVKDTGDAKTSVKTVQEAIQGAQDIVAEEVSDHADLREAISSYEEHHALLETNPTKTFEENGVYKMYKEYKKSLKDVPSYAYLALFRAEKEKQLALHFQMSAARIHDLAESYFIPQHASSLKEYLWWAVEDGLKRLLLPSLEREIRSDKKRRADEAAIRVFGENMKNLLLTPPIQWFTVLGFDPAFRTGCKLAIVDPTGKFLFHTVIYPTAPQHDVIRAEETLLELIKKYQVQLIACGNGTASRESEQFIAQVIKKHHLPVKYLITSEAGASVYSASKLAQEEYPHLDVTVRGAISIAHRVQDPLAELTKIDPKAIGVGQYQHDVDQKLLQEKLDEKVEDTVNAVGVDVNTASYPLLQYIAGLSEKIAKNIVEYRDEHWAFETKTQLKKVKGLWPKAYEQAIGFLRIKQGKEPLDETGIHPEIHSSVSLFIEEVLGIKKKDLVLPLPKIDATLAQLQQRSATYGIGLETMQDVVDELQRPGLDPRDQIDPPSFKSDVLDVKDLKIGMELAGVIRNVTDFWAFVDIGLHNDGLVHKSQLANYYVTNPIEVVSVGQQVSVRVLEIDVEREKVSLSMKDPSQARSPKPAQKTASFSRKERSRGESTMRSNIHFS